MAKLGVIGSEGRMGHALVEAIAESDHDYAGGIDKGGDPERLAGHADVLIDFSTPGALETNLRAATSLGKPVLIGTTGLEDAHHALIDAASEQVAILQTGNTSLGVNMLAFLVREAAKRLGDEWDIEIVEMHHRHKVDAPSGTALLLGEAAADGRKIDLSQHSERGRDGITGARKRGAIGFASLRGGSVAGDHQILFATENESITLSHRAENRSIFAKGAIKAAGWILDQKASRYDMKHILGLS